MTTITSAEQTRGSELGKVLKKPLFWFLAILATLFAGISAGLYFNTPAGVAAAVAGFLFVFVCGFAYAKAIAAQSFYDNYAKSRGMSVEKILLGKLTPLLSQGRDQRTDMMMSGPLDQGFEGDLALFTVTDWHLDDQRDATRKDNPFTIVHIELEGIASLLPELMVHPRDLEGNAIDAAERDVRREHKKVDLESVAFDERFEITARKDQDPNFIRQVFSPTFIVWLTEKSPKDFGFELAEGNLVAFVPDFHDDKAGFDEMIAAGSTVAARLRDESTE